MAIAVGDIHGCLNPLKKLIAALPPAEPLVFLGDYIDRGPDSAGVVRYLRGLAAQRPCRFLTGNHEDLMKEAIADRGSIDGWLINGGEATLSSYGVELDRWLREEDRGEFLRPDREFFDSLELFVEDEETIVVHAGIDPSIPDMARQKPEVLLWVRERFFLHTAAWQGKQIVFGHTPTLSLQLPPGEIIRKPHVFGIDTGCVYGGHLSALDMRTHKLYQAPSDFSYLTRRAQRN